MKLKNFFQQKFLRPLLEQLKQGVTPVVLAKSFAWGVVLGIFPLIGVSTGLCLLAAYFFKLNYVAIQIANYIMYPLQIAIAIPLYRAGEWLFQVPPLAIDISSILQQFKNNFGEAIQKFGATGMRAVVVWCLIAPVIYLVVYIVFKAIFKKIPLPKN